MNRELLAEEIETEIQKMRVMPFSGDPDSLLGIAVQLRLQPRQEFRDRLRQELLAQAEELESVASGNIDLPLQNYDPMPSFSQREFSVLPADPRSLIVSFLSHAAAVVLIASGIWWVRGPIVRTTALIRDLTYLPMPLGSEAPHGGGGGGDRSTVQVSRGTPPKFAAEQLAPPVIVVRNPTPKLQVDSTVLGPPQIKLPQSERIGDLLSPNVAIPSNGTGSRGGMGNSMGTGIGSGPGAGVGPGSVAGFGGEAFRPGNGVSAPRAIYDPDPEYSDEARRAKYQGTVVLSLIVDAFGHARNIRVARSLGMGLDEKAIDAVEEWQFAPGIKDGHAVATQVNVEVNFRLY
jgi:periplasmic protein TonB